MRRVLVTGATGNIGGAVVREAGRLGLDVVAAVRDPASVDGAAVRLDFEDHRTWRPALKGADSLFLVRPPALADMASTLCPFVDRAVEEGVGHVVFVSVLGAERKSWVPHRKVEEHLARVEVSSTILRPGFFAQNLEDAYLRDVVEDDRLYVPAGAAQVAFVDTLDIGTAAARVLAYKERFAGRTLELTGPAAIGFDAVASEVARVLARPIRYVPATIPGYVWHLARRRRLPLIQVAVQTVLHVGLRRGDAREVTRTLADVLEREPTSFAAYVERAAAEGRLDRARRSRSK